MHYLHIVDVRIASFSGGLGYSIMLSAPDIYLVTLFLTRVGRFLKRGNKERGVSQVGSGLVSSHPSDTLVT